jgi:hypothetical protein
MQQKRLEGGAKTRTTRDGIWPVQGCGEVRGVAVRGTHKSRSARILPSLSVSLPFPALFQAASPFGEGGKQRLTQQAGRNGVLAGESFFTARERSQTCSDVPISLTALTGEHSRFERSGSRKGCARGRGGAAVLAVAESATLMPRRATCVARSASCGAGRGLMHLTWGVVNRRGPHRGAGSWR